MQTQYCSVMKDGDEPWIVVPQNKTVDFLNYIRGFGYTFTLDCRGFCEDNVFCFNEGENFERLQAIVSQFPIR
jgi:hypothetical protein